MSSLEQRRQQRVEQKQTKEKKPRTSFELEFGSDPRYQDQLIQKLCSEIYRTNWQPAGELNFIELVAITQSTLKKLIDTLKQPLFLDSDSTNFIVYQTVARMVIVRDEHYRDPEKLAAIRTFVEESLGHVGSGTYTPAIDEHSVTVVSPNSLNELTIWYAQQAYRDLEPILINLAEQNAAKTKIKNLAVLGLLLGYLDDEHPMAPRNRLLLRRYLNGDVPTIFHDILQPHDGDPSDNPRLNKLKGFWHQVFVARWIASSRLSQAGQGALSNMDTEVANHQLEVDMRSAATRAGAINQATTVGARTTNYKVEQEIINEYDRNLARLEHQQKRTIHSVDDYFQKLIASYHPQHKAIKDDGGRPVGGWRTLQRKANLLFATTVREGAVLTTTKLPKLEQQRVLSQLAQRLILILISGSEHHRVDPNQLFGEEFMSLAPVEQVALILFSCLSLIDQRRSAHQTVYWISHYLQPILLQHHDIQAPPSDQPPQDWLFEQQLVTDGQLTANKRLTKLTQAEGIVSSQSEELATFIQSQRSLLQQFEQALADPGETNWDKVLAVVAFAQLFLLFPFLEKINGWDIPLFFLPQHLYFAYCYARSKMVHAPTKQALSYADLMEAELTKLADELQPQISSLAQTVKRRFVWYAILTALFVPVYSQPIWGNIGGEVVGQLDEWGVFGADYGYENRGRQPMVADQLDPEAFRGLKAVERGQIYHLPEEFSGTYGEAIAYQPFKWYSAAGGFYNETSLATQRVSTMFVDSIDQAVAMHQSQPNQLVYSPEKIDVINYPLDGYHITKVYQVGGVVPKFGPAGSFNYLDGELPKDLLLVAEKLPLVNSWANGKVWMVDGMSTLPYQPWNEWDRKYQAALRVNEQLSGDPLLQELHLNMITEANTLVQQFNQGSLAPEDLTAFYTGIALRYTIAFNRYLDTHREYSLLYQNPLLEGQAPNLRGISLDPSNDFYCTIAFDSLREFLGTIDIQVLEKPGETLKNYNGKLMARVGHVNALVLLPDGRVLFSDPTPSRPNPGEDLSMLEDPDPFAEGDEENEFPIKGAAAAGAAALATASLYFGSKELRHRRRHSLTQHIEKKLPEDFDEISQVWSAWQFLTSYVHDLAIPTLQHQLLTDSYHPDQKSLLHSLAHDALVILDRPVPEALQPFNAYEVTSSITDLIDSLKNGEATTAKEYAVNLKILRSQLKGQHKIVVNQMRQSGRDHHEITSFEQRYTSLHSILGKVISQLRP